jgi:hypothetical protein
MRDASWRMQDAHGIVLYHLPVIIGRLRNFARLPHASPLPGALLSTPKAFGASCVGREGEDAWTNATPSFEYTDLYCDFGVIPDRVEARSLSLTPCMLFFHPPCMAASQAGRWVALRPAGRRATARAETSSPSIRSGVMRSPACFARAFCPKLEPLLEHGDHWSPGLVSLQV